MAYDDTWLIVPVHNEGMAVEGVVRDALRTFPKIVCVDDGSGDDSAERVLRAGAHLVRHPVNLGQGAALQTGIEYARSQPGAQYFVTFDADGQHQVVDVQRMLARLRGSEVDMVLGTRFSGSTRNIPLLKKILLRTVVMLSPNLRMLHLTDAHNGLRVFNRTVADQINITRNGMGHASEIISMARRHSWRITEEPVNILYTEYSREKGQSLLNGVNILFESMLRISSRP